MAGAAVKVILGVKSQPCQLTS